MKEQLEAIRKHALEAIAATREAAELESLQGQIPGQKGRADRCSQTDGYSLSELRPVMGQMANEVRANVERPWSLRPPFSPKRPWRPSSSWRQWMSLSPAGKLKSATSTLMYSVLDEIKKKFLSTWALRSWMVPSGGGRLQLHQAQYPRRPPGPGVVRHVLSGPGL